MEIPSVLPVTAKLTSLKVKRIVRIKKSFQKSAVADDEKFECLVCENIYESILKLRVHVISDHNGRKVVGKLPFMCKKCGLLYRRRSHLNQHYLQKHPTVHFKGKPQLSYLPVLVEVQKEVVENVTKDVPNDFVKVQRTFVEQRFRCDICGVICKNKAAIRHHKILKHTEQNDWKCLQCSYTTKFKQYYIRHNSNKHPETGEISKRSKHVCEICGYSTHIKGHLEAHSQTHSENKSYMCEICGRRTKTKNAMISHRRMHLKDKKYSCGVDDCQFKTVHSTSLKHHRLSHDPEKNTLHCDKCNFKTFNKYSMNTHIQQHIIRMGEKILECQVCNFTTARNVTLKHHMHKHSGQFQFKCQECSFTYKCENSLRKHMKKHTPADRKDTRNNTNPDIRITPENINYEKFHNSIAQTVFRNSPTNEIKKQCINVTIGEEFLENYSASWNFNNTFQYNIHDVEKSSDHRNGHTNDRSSNLSNEFVHHNLSDKLDKPTAAPVSIDEKSSSYIENHSNFLQYDIVGINDAVEDDNKKYYLNLQNNSTSSSQHGQSVPTAPEYEVHNHSHLETGNYYIQLDNQNNTELSETRDRRRCVNNNQTIHRGQTENSSNSSVIYDVSEQHNSDEMTLDDTINVNCVNKIEKSFIQYKTCPNRTHHCSHSFGQCNMNGDHGSIENFSNQTKNQVSFIDRDMKNEKWFRKTESNPFSKKSDKIYILSQVSNQSGSFIEARTDINLSRNYRVNEKQNSHQIQKSEGNSFVLYNISNEDGQVDLRNDRDSFTQQNNHGDNINEIQHSATTFSDYINDSHSSSKGDINRYHSSDREHINRKDSANAVEIVVNKGVLMMSVDCDAFSPFQNFDYFED